ncbi:MAG TPA: response regulator transcription factor [Candidatus Acidoferrales bacterium]|jgi:DNA-binding NarL/FixJ family response regulator|nr:response regulator transcription factor [Candidatus Acidoferrales bacterium]
MKNLRILLADDHALVRRGAQSVLQSQHGWKVVAEAENGRQAIEKAKRYKPDVAVVDIGMPEIDGIEVVRQIRQALPDSKILVLTMHESDQMVRRALDAGANGYLLKSDLTETLTRAVKHIFDGRPFLTPKVSEIVLNGFLKKGEENMHTEREEPHVTPREIEIIRHLAEGKKNKEIAASLGIAIRTVETHRARVMLKLGLHSLTEIVHYAMRNELIPAPRGFK